MRSRTGLTLIELVVVLSVLAAVSGLLVPLFSGTIQNAHEVSTNQSLLRIREAVRKYWLDTKHLTLDGVTSVATESNRFDIEWLFANPVSGDSTWDFSPYTRIGWRGPYLAAATGLESGFGSRSMIDAWNKEIVVQDVDPAAALRDIRIVSGGPDGVVNIPVATATSSLAPADVGDDVYVALSLR